MNHGAPRESQVQVGDVLAGKYRVERLLGTGAMGFVVAAHHLQLDEKFAIKLLHAEALHDAERVARFAREARAAAKLKSEHVVRVADVGALPSGAPYMVMEYLDGGDLDAWVEQHGPLPVEQAVEFLLQACVAVAEAHALGIVHRDLKPSNLFCVRRSDGQLCIKLLDFGISKLGRPYTAARDLTESASEDEEAMGSPAYMSPERIFSPSLVDPRSDIWSLGVILFELLTADAPFTGKSTSDLVAAITSAPTPALSALRPDVPAELEAALAKCLAKKPDDRYADVAELAAALAPFAPSRAASLATRIAAIVAASRAAAARLPAPPFSLNFAAFRGALPPAARTQRSPAVGARLSQLALGLVFLVALSAFAGALWRRGERAPAAQATPTRAARAVRSTHVVPPPPVRANAAATDTPSVPAHIDLAAQTRSASAPAATLPATRGRRGPSSRSHSRGAAAESKPTPPQARCDPPYYFDENGNRLFKKECV